MESIGKVALITGGSSGIGVNIAELFAKRGCHIIITGSRDEKDVEEVKGRITKAGSSGVRVDYIKADLKHLEQVDQLYKKALELHPAGIDVLVNNAGFFPMSPVEATSTEVWNDSVAVMLTAPFHLTKLCVPNLKTKGWGRIVNVASVLAFITVPGISAYTAVKAGLVGLTKTVALELVNTGVTCNAVCPSLVKTPLTLPLRQKVAGDAKVSLEDSEAAIFKSLLSPVTKFLEPEQVADAVDFLCFSAASAGTTGSSYMLDMGHSLQ